MKSINKLDTSQEIFVATKTMTVSRGLAKRTKAFHKPMLVSKARENGFSLIELMIAMIIGLILVLGIATIFVNSSNNIRLQRGISNIQESGREALMRITNDASSMGAQYCAAIGTQAPLLGFTPQRTVRNFANAPTSGPLAGGLFFGLPGTPDTAVTTAGNAAGPPYNINPRFFIQGHECGPSACTPALNVLGSNPFANVPAAGTAVGSRAPNTDVLTVRYLEGNGASVSAPSAPALPGGNMVVPLLAGYNTASTSGIKRLGEMTALTNRLFMIADCSKAAIFRGDFAAASVTATAINNQSLDKAPRFSDLDNARVFDMRNNFLTVTYFIQNVADPNVAGRIIPALMRSENGQIEEVVRGVERLDFRYSVALRTSGATDYQKFSWMTADQVQTELPCPPRPKGIPGFDKFAPGVAAAPLTTDTEAGCSWRAVQGIEIGMLVTSVDGVSDPETTLTYSMDAGAVVTPAAGDILRREFRAIAPIRAWVQ